MQSIEELLIMYNFITLFDKNYLSRGLALYDSLVKHCDDFFLYILVMDNETETFLNKENLNNRLIIQLSQIESFYPELNELKKNRSGAEYCWTLTPYSIQYAIKKYNLDSCTYLDADIYFFNDPNIIFDEAGNSSIIITEHRYTPICDQTETSGKYCVQFIYFKNDIDGMEALEWWRKRCKEWCYSKCEDGKFGDQKYLDDWTTRFKNIYVPIHIGCGLAPWNIQQYDISIENSKLFSQDKITRKKEPVIFYHFHGLNKIYTDTEKIIWHLPVSKQYVIDIKKRDIIYTDYLQLISKYEENCKGSLKKSKKPDFFSIMYQIIKDIIKSLFIITKFKYYKEYLNNEYSIESLKYFTVHR
jgi:hypothetical protein